MPSRNLPSKPQQGCRLLTEKTRSVQSLETVSKAETLSNSRFSRSLASISSLQDAGHLKRPAHIKQREWSVIGSKLNLHDFTKTGVFLRDKYTAELWMRSRLNADSILLISISRLGGRDGRAPCAQQWGCSAAPTDSCVHKHSHLVILQVNMQTKRMWHHLYKEWGEHIFKRHCWERCGWLDRKCYGVLESKGRDAKRSHKC